MIEDFLTLEEAKKYKYNKWGGNPKGNDYKEGQCACEIWSGGRGSLPYQCSKKNGFGINKLYCKQHAKEVDKYLLKQENFEDFTEEVRNYIESIKPEEYKPPIKDYNKAEKDKDTKVIVALLEQIRVIEESLNLKVQDYAERYCPFRVGDIISDISEYDFYSQPYPVKVVEVRGSYKNNFYYHSVPYWEVVCINIKSNGETGERRFVITEGSYNEVLKKKEPLPEKIRLE